MQRRLRERHSKRLHNMSSRIVYQGCCKEKTALKCWFGNLIDRVCFEVTIRDLYLRLVGSEAAARTDYQHDLMEQTQPNTIHVVHAIRATQSRFGERKTESTTIV